MAIIRCPHCGTANREGSNFCNSCGVDLRADDAQNPISSREDEPTGERPNAEYGWEPEQVEEIDRDDETDMEDPSASESDSEDRDSHGRGSHSFDVVDDDSDALAATDAQSYEERNKDQDEAQAKETPEEQDVPPDSEADSSPVGIIGALLGRSRTNQDSIANESWLQMEFTPEENAPPFELDETRNELESDRLASSVTGLLSPVSIEVSGPTSEASEVSGGEAVNERDAELWRRGRNRMRTPPLLAGSTLATAAPALPKLTTRWLFIILFLAVSIPAFFTFTWPSSTVTLWRGVIEAYNTIDDLPYNSHVRIFWAYDPATSGELDLVAMSVATHLFQRQANISVVSQLPGGPATARNLLEDARLAWQQSEQFTVAAAGSRGYPIAYLPGGASVLALLARNPAAVFEMGTLPSTSNVQESAFGRHDLTIVMAAQADDVQHWLEQVQPLTGTPVIGVVAAGADPVVRPYLDSGQLVGLVSGYDGAFNYQRLLDEQTQRSTIERFDLQLMLQDWGHFVFFLAIVLGNFAAVLSRSDEGTGP